MTALGVFRDDFYNAVSVLAQSQYTATTAATSVVPASSLCGAGDCYLVSSGNAAGVTYTTDSAVNIIAAIQNAVATAYKQGLGSFAAGVNPPNGAPNLFNVTWTLSLVNLNTSAGIVTLAGGTGVTIVGTATTAIATERTFIVTITSPTTVSIQSVSAGGGVTA